MTTRILEVQNATSKVKNKLAFISFSIDPQRDSVQKLKWFANRFDLDQSNWHFVRTDKETVYKMARNDYMITAIAGTAEKNDYIHSELVVLVDKNQHVRGYYDLSKKEDYNQILTDINNLLNYYNKQNS